MIWRVYSDQWEQVQLRKALYQALGPQVLKNGKNLHIWKGQTEIMAQTWRSEEQQKKKHRTNNVHDKLLTVWKIIILFKKHDSVCSTKHIWT